MAGAIAAPSEDNAWRRAVNDGQKQASDIWASVSGVTYFWRHTVCDGVCRIGESWRYNTSIALKDLSMIVYRFHDSHEHESRVAHGAAGGCPAPPVPISVQHAVSVK